jgi:hypothetical protein
MINPLTIALQGLQPGSTPIKIASQGFILEITPPTPQPEPENEETFFVPMVWTAPRIRKDCVIMVDGCRATLSATAGNVAAGMPTAEQLDELDDIAYAEDFNRRVDEAWEAECEERAHARFMERFQQASQLRAERRAKREFRQSVSSLAQEIRSAPDATEDLAAMITILHHHLDNAMHRIAELENKQATPPKAKPAKRKK